MYKLNSRLSIDYTEEQGDIHDEEEVREEKRKGRKKKRVYYERNLHRI